jgi:predicted HTH transcriptional regulator
METLELLEILRRGEDSRRQFKKNVTNVDALTSDMVAFSNGDGGKMLIGVNDDGTIAGLSDDAVRRLNQLISNAASQGVQPAINPVTENVRTDRGLIVLVDVRSGLNKPDEYILVIVEGDGTNTKTVYLKRSFREQPDFAATSVNYGITELTDRAEVALQWNIKET